MPHNNELQIEKYIIEINQKSNTVKKLRTNKFICEGKNVLIIK